MNISVIIPVYNAALFVEKAVTSALFHNEVKEVVVVNDGSTDDSLAILQKLQETDARIKIYHHENKVNKGRSASRNLALQKATQPYFAFLDADDFYLENRFEKDKQLFELDDTVEGVYNAVGFQFYRKVTNEESRELQLYTIKEFIPPHKLFKSLFDGKKGDFHINGLTIKRTVLEKTGLFNERLKVAEDSDLQFKLTLMCKLLPGNLLQAVACRGIHNSNVFNQEHIYKDYRYKMYESLIEFSLKNNLPRDKTDLLLQWLFFFRYKENHSLTEELKYWFYLLKSNSKLITSTLAIKYCPIVRKRKQLFPILFR